MPATQNIAVLFTDLVGSTELASALSPDAADELRRGHFSTLRQAIAATGGIEVKNVGDGLMVVFPVASAALACAVAMQQVVHRGNGRLERPLGLRVGLSAGEATIEGDDYFGDPVIEAARLCALANAGQILASDLVRASAGRRSSHEFRSVGAVELKGLSHPVETLEVGWLPLVDSPLAPGGVPLPARLGHRPGVGVIGREPELEVLQAAAKRVAAGEGREVVLVAGEPGLGKTTLVAEMARRTHDTGMTVLFGRSEEDVGAPFRPFQEALSHYVAHADEELLRSHVAAHGGELARIAPPLRQRLGELAPPQIDDPETGRFLLYAAVVGLLEQAGAQSPVVLVLDDLHWADRPTLQLLRHIVANSESTRLLVLVTYRDAELSAAHPLTETLAALHREPSGVSGLALTGLDDAGVIAFMESAAGHELDEAGVTLAHDLYRETDGNPFFVAEVLRNLSESGAIYEDDRGRWTAADAEGQLALPGSVRAVIGTRVARLGDEAARVLSTAAVIGRDFDLDLLAEATTMGEDELIDLLERARHAAVVYELRETPGRYGFSHALIQHTLSEDLGATRRTRVHRAVGEAIERLYGSDERRVGELARHFLLATRPADADKAIAYARRAGEAALAALAPDEAVGYFSQALELNSQVARLDPTLGIDLLIGLGKAQRQAGMAGSRQTLLEAARRARAIGDGRRLASAALANSRGTFSALGQVDRERVEMLEAALAVLGDSDSSARARLLASLCGEQSYSAPLEQRLAIGNEAKTIARRLDDPATFVDVVYRLGSALHAPSTLGMESADTVEAMAAARALDDPVRLLRAATWAYVAAIQSAQFDLAAQCMVTQLDLAERLRHPALLWQARYLAASDALVHGDSEEAERLATSALDAGRVSEPDALSFFGIQLIVIRTQQGRLAELVSLIDDAARQNEAIPAFAAALAFAYLESGDRHRAQMRLEEAMAKQFTCPEDSAWFDYQVYFANVAIELGLNVPAEMLFDLLATYHGQVPHNGLVPLEPVAMYLGGLATVLGRFDAADSYLAEAAELNTAGTMRFAEARTQLFRARMLRLRNCPGDIRRARELLEQTLALATVRGYGGVERAIQSELDQVDSAKRQQ